MKNLLFPNTENSEGREQKEEDKQINKIQKKIELLEKEKKLEEEREKRTKKKNRRLDQRQIRKQVRKRKAMAMRMRNIPTDIIARKLGVSLSYASNLIREAVAELPEETAEDLKKLLGRTVVQLIGNFEKVALEGGVREAEVMLKGITQLMKLSGLSIQKKQVEQTNLGNSSDGIDVSDLDLDLDTKRKILEAMRRSKKIAENEKIQGQEQGNEEQDEDEEFEED